jgi:uncharacterized membrane protein YsdA (DUF1294 family)
MIEGYILWNAAAFFCVMFDKQRARHGRRRVRERTFFLWALCLGAAGILIGMYTFRHKTRNRSFYWGIPGLLVLNGICIYWLLTWVNVLGGR